MEETFAIHEASLGRFGGLPDLRDEGLLESALAQPFQAFGGAELYPTFAEKVAREDNPMHWQLKWTGCCDLACTVK